VLKAAGSVLWAADSSALTSPVLDKSRRIHRFRTGVAGKTPGASSSTARRAQNPQKGAPLQHTETRPPKSLFILALLLVAGCAGGGVPDTRVGLSSQAQLPALGTSEVRLDANDNDLLYISNYSTSAVKVYSWPDLTQEQTLRGFTQQDGLCTDPKGDVFVANTNAYNILKYPHGGTKPIATLADLPNYYPNFCAVDPVTGDLAVTNFPYGPYGSVTGNLVIYHDARGAPKPYTISAIYDYYTCGYDDHGNLVVDGSSHGVVALAILKHGAGKLQLLTLDQSLSFPGGVQWDGRHWAIGNQQDDVYQFDIEGTKGKKVGTTALNGAAGVYGFYVDKHQIVVPEYAANQVQIYPYPKGGDATMTISTGLHQPVGAVVSHGKRTE
jgi:hypothetical protein